MIAAENSPDTEANVEAECPEQDRIPGSENESEVESDPEMEMVTDTLKSTDSVELSRYSLRRQVAAPELLMLVKACLGSSSREGEGDVVK